jgi:superfamily II DNA or RNA helicase
MADIRDQLQQEAVEQYLCGKPKTCFNISVRFGKTRLGIMIMQAVKAKRVLILYPEVNIKKAWEDEFEKMGWRPEEVVYSTYISLIKQNNEKYDFIVGDEIHKASDNALWNLDAILKDNSRFLGLSGTYSDKTKDQLWEYCRLKISHEYNTEAAIEDNIVANYEVNVITFNVDRVNEYLKKTKTKQWMTTEAKELAYLTKVLDTAKMQRRDMKFPALNRMRFINKLPSLKRNTQILMHHLKGKRYLLYGADTDFVDGLGIPTHHSKNIKEDNLKKFQDGEINQLGLVQLASQGVTFKNLDTVVITNINSNSENLFQKLGRTLLQEASKVSQIYILCTEEEFQKKWLLKALADIPREKITYKNFNY